ncbi:Polyadenylate-binding protein-interacting protein 2 [Bulinus truncatus]|nr:Polyadenylate-binding protein-interacting protein 2 [Bulinus truncatus]
MNMRTPPSLLDDEPTEIIPVVQNQEVDFSEYMWMEQMEEFDRQVEEELLEQEMIEQCFEDLYEMEQIATEILSSSPMENAFITFDSSHAGMRTNGMAHARHEHTYVYMTPENIILSSKLNPLAPEFFPRGQC